MAFPHAPGTMAAAVVCPSKSEIHAVVMDIVRSSNLEMVTLTEVIRSVEMHFFEEPVHVPADVRATLHRRAVRAARRAVQLVCEERERRLVRHPSVERG